MSKNFTITANDILLYNPFGSQSITRKNKKYSDDILYQSKVNFQKSTKHKSIVLDDETDKTKKFKMKLNPDNPDQLIFYKANNEIAMILE